MPGKESLEPVNTGAVIKDEKDGNLSLHVPKAAATRIMARVCLFFMQGIGQF